MQSANIKTRIEKENRVRTINYREKYIVVDNREASSENSKMTYEEEMFAENFVIFVKPRQIITVEVDFYHYFYYK